jgi:hypothetical protein
MVIKELIIIMIWGCYIAVLGLMLSPVQLKDGLTQERPEK